MKYKNIFLFILSLELSTSVSSAIIAFHRRFQPAMMGGVTFFFIACLLFAYSSVLLVNALYELTSPRDLTIFLFLFPLHTLYVIYGVVAVPAFTVLVTQLINIRQKALLAEFNALCERFKQ